MDWTGNSVQHFCALFIQYSGTTSCYIVSTRLTFTRVVLGSTGKSHQSLAYTHSATTPTSLTELNRPPILIPTFLLILLRSPQHYQTTYCRHLASAFLLIPSILPLQLYEVGLSPPDCQTPLTVPSLARKLPWTTFRRCRQYLLHHL